MAKYILSDNIALRSWRLVPYAYYIKGNRNASGLSKEEYLLLKNCDGRQEVEESPLLEKLMRIGLCRPVNGNETLSKWQLERVCDNRYFPAMNWMITGRCNYNCLHCFNATDNSRLQSEFSEEEAEILIEEAQKCGINAFTITGGEPMIHPHFMDILHSIHSHGMYVEELNTNGFFLTQDILDDMKSFDCRPLMKISFDGLGCHEWLRNHCGAEKDALRAIQLCADNGFPVKVQANVHKLNVHTMLATAKLLDEMGVLEMRLIRTTESPRWLQNASDACLSFDEYFDEMLLFIQEYMQTNCRMEIDIWQFVHIWPINKVYRCSAVECCEGEYRDSIPVCRGNRGMVAVGANGNLYPCHQISGYYEQHDMYLGNVKTDGLQKHLQSGEYLHNVCRTVKDLTSRNEKCANCEWFKYCCGGCRTIGLALTGDEFGADLSKCLFFKGGYREKLQSILHDCKSLSYISE